MPISARTCRLASVVSVCLTVRPGPGCFLSATGISIAYACLRMGLPAPAARRYCLSSRRLPDLPAVHGLLRAQQQCVSTFCNAPKQYNATTARANVDSPESRSLSRVPVPPLVPRMPTAVGVREAAKRPQRASTFAGSVAIAPSKGVLTTILRVIALLRTCTSAINVFCGDADGVCYVTCG